jgi:Cytochrome c554 and c-prime
MDALLLSERMMKPRQDRRKAQLLEEAAMLNLRRISVLCIAAVFGLTGRLWAANPSPAFLNPPTYDYSGANSCTSCHFIEGLDHTSRALGVLFIGPTATGTFVRTGHGWYDAKHSQTDFGSTENAFCTKCHSPLQADPNAGFDGTTGNYINYEPMGTGQPPYPPLPSKFAAVTCGSCHPSNTLAAQILAANPNALAGGEVGIYIWGQNPASINAWIPLFPGGEDRLCLDCHEQRHNTDNPAFAAMYAAGVQCVDCHMAPYRYIEDDSGVPERFHDWKVGENLPYSCGVQGSLSEFTCHSEFTVQSTLALIPYMKAQHSDWWGLPPFSSGTTADAAMSTTSTNNLRTAADYLTLWRQIQAQQQQQSKK